jgi:hypothetical protein
VPTVIDAPLGIQNNTVRSFSIKKADTFFINSPEVPCIVTANTALPLYIVARRCRLDRLAGLISSAILEHCQLSQAIVIVGQVAAASCYDYDFVDPLFQMLADSIKTIPVQAFRGIEMAKAVLVVLAKADPESDPPAVLEWLVIAFRQFEELCVNEPELVEILALLPFTSDLGAFLGWRFSTVCDSQAAVDRFLSILPHFRIERIELLMSLPVDRLLWLFDLDFQFAADDPTYGVSPVPVDLWYQTGGAPRLGTYINLSSVRPRHAVVYVLAQLDDRTRFSVASFFRRLLTFIGMVKAENPVIFVTPTT